MTSLLFLLGEERYRQPRAANKFWAPCRLCCVKIFFTVNDGHWFRHPRGTLLVLEAITPALWVFVHFCAAWTTTYSLSVSLVVMVSQMPSFLAATFLVSSPSTVMRSFLGDPFRKRSRIQRYLVRQWIHVCQLTRCVVQWCSQLWIFRSCRSSQVVNFPVVVQRPIPIFLPLEDHGNSAVAVFFLVVDAPVVQAVLAMPVDVTTGRMVQTLQKFVEVPQSQFLLIVAVVCQRQIVSRR